MSYARWVHAATKLNNELPEMANGALGIPAAAVFVCVQAVQT